MPCEIEYVRGTRSNVTNAGRAVSLLVKSMRVSDVAIRKPTMISAGAVADVGTMPATGARSMVAAKRTPTMTE